MDNLCKFNINDVLDTIDNIQLDSDNDKSENDIDENYKKEKKLTIEQKAEIIMLKKDYPFINNSLYYDEFNSDTDNIGSKINYYQFIIQRYDMHKDILKKKGRIKFSKMILECKHSYIIWYNGLFQVLIIIISAIMGLVESIMAHFSDRDKKQSDFKVIFPMIGSFLILLISSITKYCKLDEKRELAALILLEAGTCLNKLKSHEGKLHNIYKPNKDWDNLLFMFQNNTSPLYSDIMLKISNMLPEEDSIFFKDKIKRDVLKMKLIDQELIIIDKNDIAAKDIKIENYWCHLMTSTLCPRKTSVKYNEYIGKHREENDKNEPWSKFIYGYDEENPNKVTIDETKKVEEHIDNDVLVDDNKSISKKKYRHGSDENIQFSAEEYKDSGA